MRKIYLFFIIGLFLLSLAPLVRASNIFYDNFESGNLNNWDLISLGSATNWTSSTTNPYQGTRHAESRPTYTTQPASVMQKIISTLGYDNIIFNYYKRNIGLDSADEFQVEWYNGTGWSILEQTGSSSSNDAAYVSRSYSLPAVASNNPNFAIKFECTAGATSEYCRIDNVNVSGSLFSCVEELQNTSWTNWSNLGSCMIDDLQQQIRNITQYDVNNCGYVNTTVYDYQNISCNYCSYSNVNTSWSDWHYLEECGVDDLREKQRNLTEYDENYATCYAVTGLASDLFINVTWFENSSDVCDYCTPLATNTSWNDWQNFGLCLIEDIQQQNRSKEQYDSNTCYAVTGLPSDEFINETFWDWQNISCDYCTPNRINTTWTDWYYTENCQINDTRERQRNKTEYDENTCYLITGLESDISENISLFDYGQDSCNYCSYSIVNSSWSFWENITCLIDNTMNQSRNKIEYDENYGSCYLVTSLPSDLWNSGNNNTYFEFRATEPCDFCTPNLVNTSWSDWNNLTCSGNQMNQSRSGVQYDSDNCGEIANQTFYDYQLTGPSLTNTSWTNWVNISCLSNNKMNQTRNLIQYDNYLCGLNITIFDYRQTEFCDYCIPYIINTTKTEWQNQRSCLINDTQLQNRSWIEYDTNNCGEVENMTYWEYREITCDYCFYNNINTTKSFWYDITSCSVADNKTQTRNWTEYDNNYSTCYAVTGLASDLFVNITWFENQTVSCDYCSYNVVNSSWTNWNNISCLIDNTMNQTRNKIEYDGNYGSCYLVTSLPSDLWNSGNNNTYFEFRQTEVCDYCTPNLINTSWSGWINFGSCLANDTQIQVRNLTQYDSNNCGEIANQTIYDYLEIGCDYCTPNLVNTSWSEWENLSCVDIRMNQSRFLIQYDMNNCNEIENQTIYEYRNILDCTNDTIAPLINIFSPINRIYNNERVLINFTADSYESLWYFNGTANRSYGGVESLDLGHGNYSFIFYANDSAGNLNFSSVSFVVNILKMNCDAGGPYQENAEVLVNGNATYNGIGIDSEEVNVGISKINYLQSKIIDTYNGAFQTSFFNLSNGQYLLNTNIFYNGINNSCSDDIKVGVPSSLFLDKIVNIHSVSNAEIVYNISIVISNTGGKIINASLNDEYYGDYYIGEINSGVLTLSYLKNFTRQSTSTYYKLQSSEIIGISSYDDLEVSANSSSINITIPAYSIAKHIIAIKNIIFNRETNRNVSYNVSTLLYNSGDEDLEGIIFIDTDINSSAIILNLQKGHEVLFSNIFVIEKEATNLEHEFALGTATIEGLVFYSNRPKINIPGYGGPADAVVYTPDSVNTGSSFDSIIEVINMNPDIGQDFVIDYWITNNDETINYSSGEKTIYVSALGRVNTSVSSIAHSNSGTYKLRAIVFWEGGSAVAFDSFEVVSPIINPPSGGGGSSGGGGGGGFITKKNESIINKTIPSETESGKEIICNPPYIRKGLECCLDENKNNICDSDEPAAVSNDTKNRGITGLVAEEQDDGEISFNYKLFSILLILLIIIYLIWRYRRRILFLFRKKQRKFNGRIKNLVGLRVYTEDGFEIGKIKEVILGENKIDSLKIKVIKKFKKFKKKIKMKGISLSYYHVKNIGEIVIIDERVLEEINLKSK